MASFRNILAMMKLILSISACLLFMVSCDKYMDSSCFWCNDTRILVYLNLVRIKRRITPCQKPWNGIKIWDFWAQRFSLLGCAKDNIDENNHRGYNDRTTRNDSHFYLMDYWIVNSPDFHIHYMNWTTLVLLHIMICSGYKSSGMFYS